MGEFNSSGYIRDRLDTWVANLKAGWFAIFGDNIDLSSDTMDGQLVGMLAEAFSNEDQKAEAVYKAFNPAESEGTSLSTLVRLNGLTRKEATYSTATLLLAGDDGTVIPAGSIVRNKDTDEPFETQVVAIISGGVASVMAIAQNSGPVLAAAGSLTIIDSNVSGWSAVTNASDANVGRAEETDAELRIRRAGSVAVSSQGNADTIYAALNSIEGVMNAVVKENPTGSVDADSIPPHTVASIILGGEDEEIAETIYNTKSAGCNTDGSTSVVVTDAQGFPQTIEFSRPSDVNIYIDIEATEIGDLPSDADDQIKAAIVAYFEDESTQLMIGSDVIYSSIYIPIMSVGSLSVTSLKIGTAPSPTGVADISIAFDSLARFDTSRINVTLS